MELWIRSQNKKQLANITGLIVVDNEIRGFTNQKDHYELGTYKTKERAIEVLDEIQEILKPKTIIKFNEKEVYDEKENMVIGTLLPYETFDIKQLSTYVYEMPIE